ncbi:hypothetical protein OH77DRAFT_1425393 [Trametes cingulata]|nr:hypothetical protein OH77DRAFT_1425393 [Trametes cingulata]
MVVLPRSSESAGDDGQIGSPRVATSTVIGMVLGILCLFTIVVSYQLLSCSCRRRRLPANRRAAVSTSTHTPSSSKRSFTAFDRLYRRDRDLLRPQEPSPADEKQSTSTSEETARRSILKSLYLALSKPIRAVFRRKVDSRPSHPARAPKLRERRALRSLYLDTTPRTPTKRYPCNPSPTPTTPIRKRMGGLFHLDTASSPGSPRSPSFFSPGGGRSRRLYQELNDAAYDEWSNEQTYKTRVPSSALISPWSPSEYEFPYPSLHSPGLMSPGVPETPPPLYPPPPAYISETPLRSPGSVPGSPIRADLTKVKPPKVTVLPPLPVSPIVSGLEEEIAGEIDAWTAFSQSPNAVRNLREGHREGVFVISNESEDEASDADSIKSASTSYESAGTWEAYEL